MERSVAPFSFLSFLVLLVSMSNSWQPSSSLEVIKDRALLYKQIRDFFEQRNVLEVDTPVIGKATVTDLHIDSISTDSVDLSDQRYYLQTSPEYAMKRLLAAGSGCIYQIASVFRQGEVSTRHNPEFRLLEWYRIGYDDKKLMQEVAELLAGLLDIHQMEYLSYRQAYQNVLGVDPHLADIEALAELGRAKVDNSLPDMPRDAWLDLLTSFCIEPTLGKNKKISFLYDYPASQAALARIEKDEQGELVAKRFEVYVDGLELANGYFELTDSQEQKQRFEQDLKLRKSEGKPELPIDTALIEALEHGLPECAGVALGLDRVLMLRNNKNNIADVISFEYGSA